MSLSEAIRHRRRRFKILAKLRMRLCPMSLTFKAPPRISPAQFSRVLEQGGSPAAPLAGELYQIILEYGLDPAIVLAFFAYESQLGNASVSRELNTRSWASPYSAYDQRRVIEVVHTPSGDFVRFASWQQGLRDWCERILQRYIERWSLDSVERVIARYVPSPDGRVEQLYFSAISRMVRLWQSEDQSAAG